MQVKVNENGNCITTNGKPVFISPVQAKQAFPEISAELLAEIESMETENGIQVTLAKLGEILEGGTGTGFTSCRVTCPCKRTYGLRANKKETKNGKVFYSFHTHTPLGSKKGTKKGETMVQEVQKPTTASIAEQLKGIFTEKQAEYNKALEKVKALETEYKEAERMYNAISGTVPEVKEQETA